MRLLLVEDEVELANPLGALLGREGHIVDLSYDGEGAWELLSTQNYDLLILDWMLPGLSGLELCRRLRAADRSTPVLMLTARDTIDNKIEGFDAGADDYLVKPFELRELLARVRALLRRPPQLQREELRVGDLVLDLRNKLAHRGERPIDLSAKEYQLLEYFMRHPGQLLTHDQILEHVWEASAEPNSNVVAAQIKLLRRKIDKQSATALIHTVYGQGYRFGP
ncbi:two-component system response regulator RppA [Gloeobacter kilaueensis]|uniref:Two component transcriptional regulator, winged helix family n=1 Tax=Gloeobacter kilaueensis (strain ATCC BAA-2537 / CCAP 1431/1 / ULC 316 / JS1) TaxID=1183438 RepID=U5QJF1_GLOK1|nr:two-component system response regulator RppA [Gloeobacter kilaueensis]AGY57749.1 two component transcriptional regulator, winged helix family [Gloeobacter kilaueensis JS1]